MTGRFTRADSRAPQTGKINPCSSERHSYGATVLDWYSMSGSFFVLHESRCAVLGAASRPLAEKRHSEMQHSPQILPLEFLLGDHPFMDRLSLVVPVDQIY